MKRVILILFITFFSIQSCENNYVLQGNRIEVNNNVKSDKEIVEFITPYKNKVDSKMDSILAYSPTNYDKKNGLLNTAIGNMMADVALKLSNPVYKARKNRDIDFVLLNHGGIRASISKGDITTRTAYNVMPFENSMVVCELDGETVEELSLIHI